MTAWLERGGPSGPERRGRIGEPAQFGGAGPRTERSAPAYFSSILHFILHVLTFSLSLLSGMDWIETLSGNRISKQAHISGSHQISINEYTTINPAAVVTGDVTVANPPAITLGKYVYISENCHIVPPVAKNGQISHTRLAIGSFTILGNDSVINLATIGNRVIVESDCKIGDLAVIYDCCIIRKGTVVPDKYVVPPFTEVSGVPGQNFVMKPLNSSYKKSIEYEAKQLHALGEWA